MQETWVAENEKNRVAPDARVEKMLDRLFEKRAAREQENPRAKGQENVSPQERSSAHEVSFK